MKKFSLLALGTLLVGCLQAAEPSPLRALLVTGGCCHDFEAQKKILTEGISARANVVWTVVHEGDQREHRMSIYEKADWAKGYDVIVHNECFGFVDDAAFVERIVVPHRDGGVPAVMLHCSSHSYRQAPTDEWRKLLGITSRSHEKRGDLLIERKNATHPVMTGFPATWADPEDECYKNEKLWPNVIPLATAYGVETKQDHVVIWLNTYGKANVFVTTLGHTNATMQQPLYLDLVTRGLLWATGHLAEDGKPAAGYGPAAK